MPQQVALPTNFSIASGAWVMNGSFTTSGNALVAHKLTQLRREPLACAEYRHLVRHISLLLAYEVTVALPAEAMKFEIRGWPASGTSLGIDPVIVPILRTGLVMGEAFQEVMPQTLTGHIGLHRDKGDPNRKLLQYLVSLPDPKGRLVILLDPVIATGDTACRALEIAKRRGAENISFVSLVVSRPGRDRLVRDHSDVHFYCAAVDETVNEAGQVLPGLGSVSERLFGFRTRSTNI
jgi:uracil phosphoribosyltransferase